MKTMTKKNVLKLAMTLVVAFIFTGVMGQVADGDYAKYSDELTTPTEIDYVTIGAKMGYYAEPDPVYHPDYATPLWTLTEGMTWTWTVPTAPGAAATIDYPVDTKPANYVEITFPEEGAYIVNVAETSPTCGPGTTTVMNVTALPAPSALLTGAGDDGDWTAIINNFEFQRCSELALGEDLTVAFTETGIPADLARYAFSIEKTVTGFDGAGVEIPATEVTTTLQNWGTNGDPWAVGGANGGSITPNTGALEYVQHEFVPEDGPEDVRTKYEFTLRKATNVDDVNHGIISLISSKSDYPATILNAQTYGFDGGGDDSDIFTVTYWVNLPPVTGPIYHIPNNFNL